MLSTASLFAETTFHRRYQRFGIKQSDRLMHTYVLGKSGVGKSTLLGTLARGDAEAGRGFALIDPHGDLVESLYARLSEAQQGRVVYLNVPDPAQPYGYNPLRRVRQDRIPLAASGMIETFEKLWGPKAWGVRMEHLLRNSLYLLLEQDGSTLPDILRVFADKAYRRGLVARCRNQVVRDFWRSEFEKYPPRLQAEATAPVQNKLGALLADPTMYRVLVQPAVDVRFRRLMDEGGILLVNLSKGRIGEDAAHLLGGLLVSTLGLAAMSRADLAPEARRPFFLYVDEFQTFTTLSFVNMWSEIRKMAVGIVAANQYLHQLEPDIRHAVLGNAGTLISFRVGPEDADLLAKEFQPTFGVLDLLNLPNQHVYLKLMIDGTPSRPFSARVLPSA
jgi:hypothetical protein